MRGHEILGYRLTYTSSTKRHWKHVYRDKKTEPCCDVCRVLTEDIFLSSLIVAIKKGNYSSLSFR